jgi:hypothetical protein
MAKTKKCKNCKNEFIPYQPLAVVCSYKCSIELSKARMETKKAKAWSKEKRERKEALKTVQELVLEVQTVFNKFIRKRDEGLPCIACGSENMKKVNASHYYNANNHWNVRFNEDNVHSGCEYCNTHLHGNLIPYRKHLLRKIGVERFLYLESISNETRKFTREELKELKEVYKQKIKEL